MSLSPATTCAAVTASPSPATQPLPAMPSPHAVPKTRTTLGAARRTPGCASTAGSGGSTIAAGPASAGNGSTARERLEHRARRGDRVQAAQHDGALGRLAERGLTGYLEGDRAEHPHDREPRDRSEQEPAGRVELPGEALRERAAQ